MNGRILSIDYGSSRVGFAVSDPLHIIATPLKTIKNKSNQNLLENINQIVKELDIETIVLGLPLGMNGKETKQTKSVREFSDSLIKNNYRVILEDERLTTVIAKKEIIKQNINTGKNKTLIDQTAAALILQNYLDRKKSIYVP
ncbi:MAG: Holliday junction resolvase RuvX [Candidatus Marinimicrobia bacterium]|jgi:putative Holliday junction resolvase|nr:Holliday junction resolvase RuvX [Candidatus Neomarinimicrobiota bacterium]